MINERQQKETSIWINKLKQIITRKIIYLIRNKVWVKLLNQKYNKLHKIEWCHKYFDNKMSRLFLIWFEYSWPSRDVILKKITMIGEIKLQQTWPWHYSGNVKLRSFPFFETNRWKRCLINKSITFIFSVFLIGNFRVIGLIWDFLYENYTFKIIRQYTILFRQSFFTSYKKAILEIVEVFLYKISNKETIV